MNKRHLVVAMLLFCAGCARTTIESNTQPGYTFTDARLLVIQQLSGDAIQQGFQASFPAYMSSCGVTTVNDVVPATPHDTEEDRTALKQRAANLAQQNGTNAFLTVAHDSSLIRTNYGIAAGALSHSFHATLQDN